MCGDQGGSDVITKTALKRINWGSYKINQTTDRVGVFVSIVSTHIPFKGAGKEYIGETENLCKCTRFGGLSCNTALSLHKRAERQQWSPAVVADDVDEMVQAVKSTLQSCCGQVVLPPTALVPTALVSACARACVPGAVHNHYLLARCIAQIPCSGPEIGWILST